MSSKIQVKRALLGLLSLAALGVAQAGQKNELDTSQLNNIPSDGGGADNTLQSAQQFRPPPNQNQRFSTNRLRNNNQRLTSSNQRLSSTNNNNNNNNNGQRLSHANQRVRPNQSGRLQGGTQQNKQPQSSNNQQQWQGQPGQPIIYNPPGTRQVCAFDEQKGPNILIAQVSVPSTPPTTEIDAWSFGDSWCSNANSISDTQDICSLQDGREFMHVPLGNKFGALDANCYANFKVWFSGCSYNDDGTVNYDDVVAIMEDTVTNDVVTYKCAQDSEHRGCLYNGQLPVPTQTDFKAFLICGIKAEP